MCISLTYLYRSLEDVCIVKLNYIDALRSECQSLSEKKNGDKLPFERKPKTYKRIKQMSI